jgi:hypothetical protein
VALLVHETGITKGFCKSDGWRVCVCVRGSVGGGKQQQQQHPVARVRSA